VEQRTLTGNDVSRLLQDPSPENRAEAAVKVSGAFNAGNLSDNERKIAETIFRTMIKDAAVLVRTALSESLADNPDVPHDVAKSLALDVAEVALPMIESSYVLTDEDLIEIIETKGEVEQQAIARRDTVSSTIADALVDTDNENVVASLVSNEGADISHATFEKVLDKFGDKEIVSDPLSRRAALPLKVSERLVTMVSDKIREHIMSRHDVSEAMASDLLLEAREKATVSLLGKNQLGYDVVGLVKQIHENERLTPTLIIRALCMGDVLFFETALSVLAGIPAINVYELIHDKGTLGLSKLFERAGIPEHFVKVAKAAMKVSEEMVRTSGDDRKIYQTLMIERVLTALESEMETENESVDYLISKLNRSK
jgi:uncharacterized protein (DUF2336 family)